MSASTTDYRMPLVNWQALPGVRALGGALALVLFALGGCAVEHPEAASKEIPRPAFPPPPSQARFVYERTIRTSTDVEREAEGDSMRRYLTGEQRIGEALSKPYGIAADHGRVFVADSVRRAVFLLDTVAGRVTLIGADDPGKLMMPLGLEVAGDELYVVDGSRHAVLVFDLEGHYRREIGDPTALSRPSGIAVAEIGGQWRAYVVDTGGVSTSAHRVAVFDAHDGRHLYDFGTRGNGDGEFNLPRDVAVAPNGEVFVVDGGNFRVEVFDSAGKYLRSFGEVGRQGGQFSRPKELAIDQEGNVYVVDAAFGNFQVFSAKGELLLDVGFRSNVDQPAGFMLPAGIAVDFDGLVYVVDQYFRKIEVFRRTPPPPRDPPPR